MGMGDLKSRIDRTNRLTEFLLVLQNDFWPPVLDLSVQGCLSSRFFYFHLNLNIIGLRSCEMNILI